MKYEVIIFDADGTLFDFEKSEMEAIKNTSLHFGINYDENYHLKVYKDINTKIWKEFEEGIITQKKLKTERFDRFFKRIEMDLNSEEFALKYMEELALGSFLFEESTKLIEKLHGNVKLTILTNGLTLVQNGRIKKSTIAKYFEDIVISEEVGVSKPNSEIFEIALNNISHRDKSKVLIVGDSLTSDIKGGINFGIDTCYYNPNGVENTSGIVPTYEIKNLLELENILY